MVAPPESELRPPPEADIAFMSRELGLPIVAPPNRVAIDVGRDRHLSGLQWGDSPPELILLHGRSQNAHTWDAFAIASGRRAVAMDLPGHGQSCDATLDFLADSALVASGVESLCLRRPIVAVGASLGGLMAIALTRLLPSLRGLVVLDVIPDTTIERAVDRRGYVDAPTNFATFDEMVSWTIAHNPDRAAAALRRGVWHNARQQSDGSWTWRYVRNGQPPSVTMDDRVRRHLWACLPALRHPVLLVRGRQEGSMLDDVDETRFLRACPTAMVTHLDAGHAVHSGRPKELASLVDEFVDRCS